METLPTITAAELHHALQTSTPLVVLDVREEVEFAEFPLIAGAVHIPLAQVPQRAHELDPEKPIAVICRAGGRSAQATAFLLQMGFDAYNVAGGMTALCKLI